MLKICSNFAQIYLKFLENLNFLSFITFFCNSKMVNYFMFSDSLGAKLLDNGYII